MKITLQKYKNKYKNNDLGQDSNTFLLVESQWLMECSVLILFNVMEATMFFGEITKTWSIQTERLWCSVCVCPLWNNIRNKTVIHNVHFHYRPKPTREIIWIETETVHYVCGCQTFTSLS